MKTRKVRSYGDKGRGDIYGTYDKGMMIKPDVIAGRTLNACQSVEDNMKARKRQEG